MSTKSFDEVRLLHLGSYDSRIRVRVIRLWRGISTTGEEFKGFNVILLDDKNGTIHASIPALCAFDHERKLKVGNVCIITNFTVEEYKMTDKFRSLRNDKKLIFSKSTKRQAIENTLPNIEADWFDIYDHSDLKSMSQQNVHLADVAGIIKEHMPLNKFKNRHGKNQSQARFTITDGSSNIKVTFWDQFGDYFENAMHENIDKPVIIIIASARVGWWNDEVILSNVGATKFYLNYPHHSVRQLRRMLTMPGFRQIAFATNTRKAAQLLCVRDVITLGNEYIDTEVLVHVKVGSVKETNSWYYNACTSCHNQTELENSTFSCIKCNRNVPYPEMKFKIFVDATDATGAIDIMLGDREMRTLIGKRAVDIYSAEGTGNIFPAEVRNIFNKEYTIKLCISEANIVNHINLFWATNICLGFKLEHADNTHSTHTMQESITQETTSTYHLDAISDLNFQSPQSPSNKGKAVAGSSD